jgi:hypothetical protein
VLSIYIAGDLRVNEGRGLAAPSSGDEAITGGANVHDAASVLAELLLAFPRHCLRIVEHVTPSGNECQRDVSFLLRLPDDLAAPQIAPALYRVPTLGLPRGRALSPVTFHDSAGVVLEPMQSDEAKTYFALALEAVTTTTLSDWAHADSVRRTLVEYGSPQIARLVRRIAVTPSAEARGWYRRIFESNARDSEAHKDIAADLDLDLQLVELVEVIQKNELLRALAERLSRYYFLLLRVAGRPGEVVQLYCSYRQPLVEKDYESPFWDLARRLFGTDAHRFRFGLALAKRAKSYHFTIDAPPGHFVREQSIREVVVETDTSGSGARPQLRVSQPLPQGQQVGRPSSVGRQAHLYLAGVSGETTKRWARIVFYEQAPGTQGQACLLAFGQALAIVCVLLRLNSFLSSQIGAAVPTLFLALPGALGALFYPHPENDRLHSAPIRSRITSASVIGTSLVLTVSFLYLVTMQVTAVSWVTIMMWLTASFGELGLAIWCLRGLRHNVAALTEATRYRESKSDFFDDADYEILKERDQKSKGRGKK